MGDEIVFQLPLMVGILLCILYVENNLKLFKYICLHVSSRPRVDLLKSNPLYKF